METCFCLQMPPLDADWSTLPARQDYVPFLHELVFHLARGSITPRNVVLGELLELPIAPDLPDREFVFQGPHGRELPAENAGDPLHSILRSSSTVLPGICNLVPAKGAENVPSGGVKSRLSLTSTAKSPTSRLWMRVSASFFRRTAD